ncbi:MAG: phenylalanine--tRNA ligase subunit alpha, partial [Acidimicrobiia bacterium]
MTLSELTARLDEELARAKDQIGKVETAADLDEVERTFLGKRSVATTVNQAIKDLAPDERPKAGQAVSAYKTAVTELIEARRVALGDGGGEALDRLDLTLPGRGLGRGHLHLITQVQQELEEVFLGLGYEVA